MGIIGLLFKGDIMVHKDRYGKNGVKELTGILEKIDALLSKENAEIDYTRIFLEQNDISPKAIITIMLK